VSKVFLRKLSALGYQYKSELRLAGLKIHEVLDPVAAGQFLIVQPLVGINWPSVFFLLQANGIEATVSKIDQMIVLVVAGSPLAREVLSGLNAQSKKGKQNQVHIFDVGFIESETKSKFDFRSVLFPCLSALVVIFLAIFWPNESSVSPEIILEETPISCALDLNQKQIDSIFLENIISNKQLATGATLIVESALGVINLSIQESIGSAVSVLASIACTDGRVGDYVFRADVSGSGSIIQLGQKLNP
jgi:hypothetical protein